MRNSVIDNPNKAWPRYRFLAATFGLLTMTACASSLTVAPSGYTPPAGQPPIAASTELFGSAQATLTNAANDLESRGFTTNRPTGSNLLVATYSGDLADLVDCGELMLPGDTVAQAASQPQIAVAAFSDREGWKALRQMRLDARSLTKTRNAAGGFLARTDVTYVVTRTIDTISTTGAVLGTDREIISFESGAVGRFENGLTCQPTGALEDQIGAVVAKAASLGGGIDGLTPMDEALPAAEPVEGTIRTTEIDDTPLPPPSLAVGEAALLGTDVLDSGSEAVPEASCGSIPAADAALLAPGGCGAQRFADEIGQSSYPAFAIGVAGGEDGLATGSPLTLEVTLPGGDRYFHVAYLASDGLVYHAGPKYIDRQGVGERFLYQTNIDLAENDRIELIMAMSSPRQIFAFERPLSEPAIDFLAVINQRFDRSGNDLAIISLRRDVPN